MFLYVLINFFWVNFYSSKRKVFLPEVTGGSVVNVKGDVVGLGVVVVKHTVVVLVMVPLAPHTAVMQFPRPSVVL